MFITVCPFFYLLWDEIWPIHTMLYCIGYLLSLRGDLNDPADKDTAYFIQAEMNLNESELIESVKCLWPAGLPGERARDLRVFAVLQETLLDHQLSRHILVQTPSRCVHIHHCPAGCWIYHEHGREKPSRDPRSAPAARKLSAAHVIKNSTRTIHSNTTCESISAHEQIIWSLNPLIL